MKIGISKSHLYIRKQNSIILLNRFNKIEEITDFEEPDIILKNQRDINALYSHLSGFQKHALELGGSYVIALYLGVSE